VNIFGGIMRCDTIAEGVIAAAKEVKLAVPLVVRMKGTNEDIGRRILRESGLPIISADNMADAAQKIVAAVAGNRGAKFMSILIDRNTKVMTQGITGKTGAFHTRLCRGLRQWTRMLRRRSQSAQGGRRVRRHPHLRHRGRGQQKTAPRSR